MKTYSLKDTGSLLAAALLAIARLSEGHSWPEETQRIAPNGTFVGPVGYPRAWILKDDAKDLRNEYQPTLPEIRKNRKLEDVPIVRKEKLVIDATSAPMLKAAPGDWVAVKHAENGHVSLPETLLDKIKPINRGTIYLYGTNSNDLTDVRFGDVHGKWTADGSGGNKKGRLLATRHYDDGQCFETENNETKDPEGIKAFRRTNFPVPITGTDERQKSLLCQSDIKLPEDLPIGKVYTVIWIWDWPLMKKRGVAVAPPTLPQDPSVSTMEVYTGVVDIQIVDQCDESLGDVKGPKCAQGGGKNSVQFVQKPSDFRQVAIKKQMENLFMVTMPDPGKPMKDGVNYNISDIPYADLIGVDPVPFPLPNEWQIKALNRHNEVGSAGGAASAPSATQPATSSHTGGGSASALSSTAPAPAPATSSATQPGSPSFGGVFVPVTSSTAPAPAASSAPVSSASQASTSVPTSTVATVSQESSASAPAGTDKPSQPNGHNVNIDQTKTVWITETTQMPVATIFVTATTTEVDTMTVTATTTTVDTMTTTVAVSHTVLSETGSAPKFRRGKGQWGFVNRN